MWQILASHKIHGLDCPGRGSQKTAPSGADNSARRGSSLQKLPFASVPRKRSSATERRGSFRMSFELFQEVASHAVEQVVPLQEPTLNELVHQW